MCKIFYKLKYTLRKKDIQFSNYNYVSYLKNEKEILLFVRNTCNFMLLDFIEYIACVLWFSLRLICIFLFKESKKNIYSNANFYFTDSTDPIKYLKKKLKKIVNLNYLNVNM